MGLFHTITHVFQNVTAPIGNTASQLFDGKSSLLRLALNPGDPVALGQTLNRTVQGDSPSDILHDNNREARQAVNKVGDAHQHLWDNIGDGVHWVGHEIKTLWDNFWHNVAEYWQRVGGDKIYAKLSSNIHTVVLKWGGERRVAGWAVVVVVIIIYIILEFFTVGGASAGAVAILAMIGSMGLQQGLAPNGKPVDPSVSFIGGPDDHSVFNSTDTGSAGSGQSGSGLSQFMNSLGNIPPLALAGMAVVGAIGVMYLLKR